MAGLARQLPLPTRRSAPIQPMVYPDRDRSAPCDYRQMEASRLDSLTEDLLREADSLFLELLHNDLVGVYIIQDNRFLYANTHLAELFGYTQAELCGTLGPMDLTAPEFRHIAKRAIDRRINNEATTSRYSFDGLCKDGRRIQVEVFGIRTEFAGRPAIIGMMIDNTDRRQAEHAVEEQLNFTSQLIDTIPSPVFYKDEAGRYLGCNEAFEHYIGLPREELIGKSVFDISPRHLAERYHAADQALFDAPGTQTYEAEVQSTDGTLKNVVFYKATFNKSGGQLGGLVGVILDITDRKRSEKTIWHQANYDLLTELPNRRLFLERLQQGIEHAKGSGSALALMFIDLDRFKEVNDMLGHKVGDQLLSQAGQRIADCVRETGLVARLGGDEFTVILENLSQPTPIEQVAQSIIETLSKPFQLGADVAYVSASIGVTLYPKDAQDMDTLLINADQAMYHAKALGKNRFCYFVPSIQAIFAERLQLGHDLRSAMAQDQLNVYYQPIVDLATGQIVKAEALVRWHHPRRGWISPAQFIPIAEDIGLINGIGDWVFRRAAGMAKRLWESGRSGTLAGAPLQISINKSPRQFFTGHAHETWIDHLQEIGLPAECIAIEITEGLLLDERPDVTNKLQQFRRAGIQVSLDDFGTGYSAMAYLKRLDIDYLKIDQSFVRDMTSTPSDRAITEAIIAMSHKLGLRVVAEGVETREQRDLLSAAGCDFGQGYWFSRALPEDEFFKLLQHWPD
nr:EAL domain-containing protein [uncultured Pseudogulbenkiania sp.]